MRQWTVDAFASEPFKGNPACVTEPLAAWRDAGWMQKLAMENNQAETAFLTRTDNPARFGLRWFTPAEEVPLCGHATLASGHALFAEMGLQAEEIVFETKSGELRVRRSGAGYEMDFPARPARPIPSPPGLAVALGAEPLEVFEASRNLLAVMADEATVRALDPDLYAIKEIAREYSDGPGNVLVTALGDRGGPYDLVSRYFAPGSGIPEDPTTGSAHCILTPLFSKRLGRRILNCHQAYPGRGGDLTCEDRGERVLLRGPAVTVAEASLRL